MELQHIALDALRIAPLNARTHDADRDLETLTASIQSLGLLQPLLVRPQDNGFEIVAGGSVLNLDIIQVTQTRID